MGKTTMLMLSADPRVYANLAGEEGVFVGKRSEIGVDMCVRVYEGSAKVGYSKVFMIRCTAGDARRHRSGLHNREIDHGGGSWWVFPYATHSLAHEHDSRTCAPPLPYHLGTTH